MSTCAATNGDNSNVSMDGDTVTIKGETYNPPFGACPGGDSSATTMNSIQQGVLVKAVGVVAIAFWLLE